MRGLGHGRLSFAAQAAGGRIPFLDLRDKALARLRAEGLAVEDAAEARLEEGARRLGLPDGLSGGFGALSGGERKRAGLLRVLVEKGTAVLVATHDFARVAAAGLAGHALAEPGPGLREIRAAG